MPYDCRRFADAEHPLRASSLPQLIGCPMRQVLLDAGMLSDESGPAAQTGSLLHAYAATWHGNGKNESEAATRVDASAATEFPLADPDAARRWFAAYTRDPRNTRAVLAGCEQSVTLTLPPADHDPTGQPVCVRGTLDQIREEDGGFRVWDLKTGRPTGLVMLDSYALQLAAYTLAAAQWLGVDRMLPPGVIRLQGYDAKGCDPSLAPPGVFFQSVLSWERCQMLCDEVRNVVADIRSGRVDIRPGFSCSTICPARGTQTCLALGERLALAMG